MQPELSPTLQLVRRWLAKAQNDLESARWLLERQPPMLDTACFHCQQSTEKALKAILVLNAVDPPRTHGLKMLFDACAPFQPGLAALQPDCEWLTVFAVETRYPDSPAEPTVERAKQAEAAADRLFRFILTLVPSEAHP